MKRTAKRILALVMTILTLLPAAVLFVDAATTLDLPIVYVVGKFEHIYDKKGNQLYPLDPPLGDTIKDHMSELLTAYNTSNSSGNWKIFADKIYDVIAPRYAPLVMDANGNPQNGTAIKTRPAPKKKTSGFKLNDYMYTYDSRRDPYATAKELKEYIDAVLAATGKSKVNLIGRCLGTTVMATYLTAYGKEKKVETAIFYASAFNGVYMMDAFFSGDIDIDYGMMQYYLAYGKDDEGGDFGTVHEIADIFSKLGLLGVGVNKVNQVIEKMSPYLFPRLVLAIFGTWPGHWAMISSGAYQKALAVTMQDAAKYAGLIKKLDKYQTNVMAKFPQTLETLRKGGLRVAVVCKYNSPLVPLSPKSDMQADGTVELKTMSLGALAADIGQTLSNSYLIAARRAGHDPYISKDLVIDAYPCQYRDYTWFIKNCPHGEYPPEIDTMFMEIFHSSTQYTVNTNSKFPQFVTYNTETKKIAPVTGPDTGADTSGGLNSSFFNKIVDWIRSFLQKIVGMFGSRVTG